MQDHHEEARWEELDKAKKLMLSRSDWTQLLDSGLTVECILEWRKWRQAVRDVSRSTYDMRIDAKNRLFELNRNKPDEVKGDGVENFNGVVHRFIDRDTVRKAVGEVLSEQATPLATVEPPPTPTEEPLNVKETLRDVYIAKIEDISPHPSLMLAYMERLNQAIDYMAGQGANFPLLDEDSIDKDTNATMIIKAHGELIRRYTKITKAYDKYNSMLEDGTIDEVEKLPNMLYEELNGY